MTTETTTPTNVPTCHRCGRTAEVGDSNTLVSSGFGRPWECMAGSGCAPLAPSPASPSEERREATADAGMNQEGSTARTESTRDAMAHLALIAEVASVARWLVTDSGYTRKMAATALADLAHAHNDAAWTPENMALLLGDAASLPRTINLPPRTMEPV